MNKTELINAIAKKTGKSIKDTGEFVDAAILTIEESLAAGEEVSIMKFGKFYSSLVAGRKGKNPLDPKKTIEIPDTMRVYFTAGKELKEYANKQLSKKKVSKKK